MWAGWLGDYARGELEGSIRPCAEAVESRSGTNTCRPLLSAFCCSSKTRLLCKTFFSKYYKMGAAQKPKLFTRKTIKLGKRQIKTNKATQLKTLKNVNCRSPPFVTRMEAVISGLSGAWVPHTLGYTHGPDRALRECPTTVAWRSRQLSAVIKQLSLILSPCPGRPIGSRYAPNRRLALTAAAHSIHA